jgi:chemotaxis protein MotA
MIVILGTAFGTILISTPLPVLKLMIGKMGAVLKGSGTSASAYLDTLKMLYELFQLARKDGLVAIEAHIEAPEKSTIFNKYPAVGHHHHALQFFCDNLRLVLVGSVPPHDLDALMDSEIELHHHIDAAAAGALQKVSDALPGIGIVAAVLGIIVTMGHMDAPPAVIGHHVAAALVGTFLGILLCYGIIQPLAGNAELQEAHQVRFLSCIKAGLIASTRGASPMIATEFARKAIFSDERPTAKELDKLLQSVKN